MQMAKFKVGCNSLLTDEIPVLNDIKQGCTLAPLPSDCLGKAFGTAIR